MIGSLGLCSESLILLSVKIFSNAYEIGFLKILDPFCFFKTIRPDFFQNQVFGKLGGWVNHNWKMNKTSTPGRKFYKKKSEKTDAFFKKQTVIISFESGLIGFEKL